MRISSVPKPKYTNITVKSKAENMDIRKALEAAVPMAKGQCAELAKKLRGSDEMQTAKLIYNFVVNNVKYKKDGTNQNIKFPSRLLNGERYGDCKSISLLIACILENMKIPYQFVYASYNPKNKTPQHVYIQTKNGIIIDPVWGKFNSEKPAAYKYYKDMNVNYLAGIGGHRKYDGIKSDKRFVAIENVKKGTLFCFPDKKRNYILDGYDRSVRKYLAHAYDDINSYRYIKKGTIVDVFSYGGIDGIGCNCPSLGAVGIDAIIPVAKALAINTAANIVAQPLAKSILPTSSLPVVASPIKVTTPTLVMTSPLVSAPKPVSVSPAPVVTTPSPVVTTPNAGGNMWNETQPTVIAVASDAPPLVLPADKTAKEKMLNGMRAIVKSVIAQMEADPKARQWVAQTWGVDMVPIWKQFLSDEIFLNAQKRNAWLMAIAKRYWEVAATEAEKADKKKSLFEKIGDKIKDTAKAAVEEVKSVGQFVWRGIKFAAGFLPRTAFTGLVRANVFGLATDLYKVKAKDRNALRSFWKNKAGSLDFSTLEQAINLGVKEKRILGCDNDYIGCTDPASCAAAIASATPLIVAAKDMMKALGIPSSIDANKAKELEDKLAKSAQNGTPTPTPSPETKSGMSTTTKVLLGVGAAAGLYYIVKNN